MEYIVSHSYYAVPSTDTKETGVFDVILSDDTGTPIVMVTFSEKYKQRKGVVFWQIAFSKRIEHNRDLPQILDLARAEARSKTGWKLEVPEEHKK